MKNTATIYEMKRLLIKLRDFINGDADKGNLIRKSKY